MLSIFMKPLMDCLLTVATGTVSDSLVAAVATGTVSDSLVAAAALAVLATLAAHQVTHSGVGVASDGLADAVHATQTTLHNVAGRVGDSARSIASGLEQVAYRAVDGAKKTTTTAGVATILTVAASVATVLAVGHLVLLYARKNRIILSS